MMRRSLGLKVGGYLLLAVLLSSGAQAQFAATPPPGELPPVFDGVSLDEQIGAPLPLDLTFQNSEGETVALRDYFDGERPVALNLVYHNCPMLCNLTLQGHTRTLAAMEWTPGEQFEMITVSFAADETPAMAARQKARFVQDLGRPEAAEGWHFLTGDAATIQKLTEAVGFRYKWVEEAEQYAHPAGMIFISPSGTLTRYLHGMSFPAPDVRKALVEATDGTLGTTVDKLLFYCFQYDPTANSYVASAINIMKIGGVLTVLILGAVLFVFWRRETDAQTLASHPATA